MRLLPTLMLLFPVLLYSQNEQPSSTAIMELADVDTEPVYAGCEEEDFSTCSLPGIAGFLLENIDRQVLATLDPGESVINLKLIIDNKGKMRRAMAQGKSEELKEEGVKAAKLLPDFKPATFEGKAVHVIVDVPIKLQSKEPIPFKSDLYDTPAMVKECKNKNSRDEILRCTSNFVQNYINRNFNPDKIKIKDRLVQMEFHFVIDENGKPVNITATGDDQKLIKEGIRTIKTLPDFIPATKNNEKIQVSYRLPMMIMSKSAR